MRRQPEYLLARHREFLIEALTEIMQTVEDAIFVFSTHSASPECSFITHLYTPSSRAEAPEWCGCPQYV
jgi:hypothetical protein